MKCPVCEDVRMREVEKDGVLIDVCPDCKGVWLDRGELDKLSTGMRELRTEYDRLERRPERDDSYDRGRDRDDRDDDSDNYRRPGGYDKHGRPYKKKKNMLDVFGDLFD